MRDLQNYHNMLIYMYFCYRVNLFKINELDIILQVPPMIAKKTARICPIEINIEYTGKRRFKFTLTPVIFFLLVLKPQSGIVDLRSADCISSLALSSLVGLESLNFTPADPSNSIKINCTSELNPRLWFQSKMATTTTRYCYFLRGKCWQVDKFA